MQKLESVQYNASLAITGCFRGTFRDKFFSELGLENFVDRRFIEDLLLFTKLLIKRIPNI